MARRNIDQRESKIGGGDHWRIEAREIDTVHIVSPMSRRRVRGGRVRRVTMVGRRRVPLGGRSTFFVWEAEVHARARRGEVRERKRFYGISSYHGGW